jgi:HEAT repeat protein
MEELRGGLSAQARGLLESMGRTAFLFLSDRRHLLDTPVRQWLISWGAREFPDEARDLVSEALEDPADDTRLAALQAVSRYGAARTLFSGALRECRIIHGDKAWELAAIRAGMPLADIADRVRTETDLDIRLALIGRLDEAGQTVDVLCELLEDGEWKIRAAATEALCALGESGVDAARRLSAHQSIFVRTAAARILARAGELPTNTRAADSP